MNSRGTKLTYAGLTALARANTGERLLFTRVVMGDGDLEEGQNIRELTNLVHPVLELPILENRVTGVGTSIIETELKNMQLQRGFMAKELGVYATIGEDAEFLYSVRNTGTDSEYIPAGGGPEVVDVVYEVVTVVDQAENVYANISGVGSAVAKKDFQAHIENINPHKNFLQIGKQVESCQNIFVNQGNQRLLDHMTLNDFKRLALGGEGQDIANLSGQMKQLFIEIANIALKLEALELYPDYNALMAENFYENKAIDQFSCKVLSIMAGDDSIDIESAFGLIPGAWYTVSDGNNQERIQAKAIGKSGNTYRVLAAAPIQNTYMPGKVFLYRSTAALLEGGAQGAGDQAEIMWSPDTAFSGVTGNTQIEISMSTKLSDYNIDGDITLNTDGTITLI